MPGNFPERNEGKLHGPAPVSEVSIAGPARERGRIMGAALLERIRVFLDEIRVRIGRGGRDPFGLPAVSGFIEESARIIELRLPDIALEVCFPTTASYI